MSISPSREDNELHNNEGDLHEFNEAPDKNGDEDVSEESVTVTINNATSDCDTIQTTSAFPELVSNLSNHDEPLKDTSSVNSLNKENVCSTPADVNPESENNGESNNELKNKSQASNDNGEHSSNNTFENASDNDLNQQDESQEKTENQPKNSADGNRRPMNVESCDSTDENNTRITDSNSKEIEVPGAEATFFPQQSVYQVKWIRFKGNQVGIITQNENGPCPLLAIMNCLLLRGKVRLPATMEIITSGQLMEYLGDCIFESTPKDVGEEFLLNYEQNMSDAMAVFDKLQTGLDVNVRFTGVREFEYTSECIVFDLLGIQLYHGWLADPQNAAEMAAVGQCSYNQLVEKIIENKHSAHQHEVTEALVAEEFLLRSGHQLTYPGLSELIETLSEGELTVFFRNNHFSTLLRHKNELFLLVTDQGFLNESHAVWETLGNVEGDGHFVDADFHTYRRSQDLPATPLASTALQKSATPGSPQQIDQDYLVALSLQEDTAATTTHSDDTGTVLNYNQPTVGLSDHELALRLQEEEDRHVSLMLQQQQQEEASQAKTPSATQPATQPSSRSPRAASQPASQATTQEPRERQRKKSSDCVLL